MSWWKWVGSDGDVLGLDRFGASAPGTTVLEKLGFTAENIAARARALLATEPTTKETPWPPTHASRSQRLSALGQSVWIDFLSRESIRGGHLQELIDDYSVVGATSNPTIFQKAMTARRRLRRAAARAGRTGASAEETLLGAGRAGHQRGLRPVPPGLGRGQRAATATSRSRSTRASPTTRSRRSARRCACTRRSTAQPDGQDPGHQAGAGGDRGRDREGPLDQRHADLLAAALRRGGRVLHARHRAAGRRGRRPAQGGLGGELLRLADRHRGRPPPR